MPYYRHAKDAEPISGEAYTIRAQAVDALQVNERITFVASDEETAVWHQRELSRYHTGKYRCVPWTEHAVADFHYAHLSTKAVGHIAYTPDEEYGHTDRQVSCKPGKYLAKFYKDIYSASEIEDLAAQCLPPKLYLATTPEDITAIYNTLNTALRSCMQRKAVAQYTWQGAMDRGEIPHPCTAYANSDLAVAYIGKTPETALARAVVWPEKRIYARIYGDTARMEVALSVAEYQHGSLDGAKLRIIRGKYDQIVAPYVDTCDHARIEGDYLVLDSDGEIDVQTLTGYVGGVEPEEDPEPETRECDHCGDDYDPEADGTSEYCRRCERDRMVCDHCDGNTWDAESVGHGDYYCEDCANEHVRRCKGELWKHRANDKGLNLVECEETWVDDLEFTQEEQTQRKVYYVTDYCKSCAEHKQACAYCEKLFDSESSQCPHCHHTVRCEYTEYFPGLTCEPTWVYSQLSEGFPHS